MNIEKRNFEQIKEFKFRLNSVTLSYFFPNTVHCCHYLIYHLPLTVAKRWIILPKKDRHVSKPIESPKT